MLKISVIPLYMMSAYTGIYTVFIHRANGRKIFDFCKGNSALSPTLVHTDETLMRIKLVKVFNDNFLTIVLTRTNATSKIFNSTQHCMLETWRLFDDSASFVWVF